MRLSILRAGALACAVVASGCQSIPAVGTGINNTYLGKELAPVWIREHHHLVVSNGHELRGYHPVRRHWFQ